MKEYIEKSVLIAMCKGIAACDWNKRAAPVSWEVRSDHVGIGERHRAEAPHHG